MATTPATPDNVVVNITVEGVTYDLDIMEMSGTEVGILKRTGHIAGVVEIFPALQAGDLEVVVALAIIAARRVGVTLNEAKLMDGKMGVVKLAMPDQEADANPPVQAAPAAEPEAAEAQGLEVA